MDDDSWVDQVRVAAGPCPHCGSGDVRPLVFGMPDAGSYHRLQDVVEFAGCTVPDDAPRVVCGACRHTWGSR
ncbi:MAG: hypothetical protein JWM64_2336 [Frankiales bacterium]|nr:hypothetical protein [Frankiales bacterium]